jgi:hypothetical protein
MLHACLPCLWFIMHGPHKQQQEQQWQQWQQQCCSARPSTSLPFTGIYTAAMLSM